VVASFEPNIEKQVNMLKRQRKSVSKNITSTANEFIDYRDGKKYRTVKIGNRTWMAENLNYQPVAFECRDKNDSNCNSLYNWYAAKTACPAEWHLPTHKEWNDLNIFLGEKNVADMKLGDGGGRWWAATVDEYGDPYLADLSSGSSGYSITVEGVGNKGLGYSVRCVKD
jgi:hypothetical protein